MKLMYLNIFAALILSSASVFAGQPITDSKDIPIGGIDWIKCEITSTGWRCPLKGDDWIPPSIELTKTM